MNGCGQGYRLSRWHLCMSYIEATLLNMAAARVIHVACSEYPGLANTLRKQLHRNAELNALVTVKDVDPNDCKEELQRAEVIFADPAILQAHVTSVSQARWIHSTMAGVDRLMAEVKKSNVTPPFLFTRSGGVFGQVMAEYIIGQIIANERRFYAMHDCQTSGQWAKNCFTDCCRPLSNISIGILGVGDIGRKIAAVSKQLGMCTWGLVRTLPLRATACPHIDEYRTLPEMEDLLSSCDYICNVLPSTSETRGLLSGSVLESCKEKQAVLINVGRGDITDEDTIVRAIQSKWISKAILDVFPVEPLPRSSPLWSMPEVVITPHVSGSGQEHMVCSSFIDNLRLYIAGRPLQYLVNWTREY